MSSSRRVCLRAPPRLSVSLQFIVQPLHRFRVQAETAGQGATVKQSLPTPVAFRGHDPGEDEARGHQPPAIIGERLTKAEPY